MRTRTYMYVNINVYLYIYICIIYDISLSVSNIHLVYISISPSLRSMSRQGARESPWRWWLNSFRFVSCIQTLPLNLIFYCTNQRFALLTLSPLTSGCPLIKSYLKIWSAPDGESCALRRGWTPESPSTQWFVNRLSRVANAITPCQELHNLEVNAPPWHVATCWRELHDVY